MKLKFIKSIILVAIFGSFFTYCKKSIESDIRLYDAQREWIHENGGIYKNESLFLKSANGILREAKLDWKKVNTFKVGEVSYIEIPFLFTDNNDQYRSYASDDNVSFSFMIRKINDKTEAAIKLTHRNVQLKGENSNRIGAIEAFNRLDGTNINVWFNDASSGELMSMRKQTPLTTIKSNSTDGILRATSDCMVYSVRTYEYHCNLTGLAFWDTACGWALASIEFYAVCLGGGAGETGGGGWPPGKGATGGSNSQQLPRLTPCDGDIMKNPTIARSSPTNVNGGRFGPTRIDAKTHQPKWHKGLDLFAQPNTKIYSAYGGVVKRAISTFPSTYYGSPTSFGNLIEIESTLPDGSIIKMLYAHLNSVDASLQNNSIVQAGQEIGLSGRTGNAQRGYSPHVHVQVTMNGQKVNPETYLATKFNTAGNTASSPCN